MIVIMKIKQQIFCALVATFIPLTALVAAVPEPGSSWKVSIGYGMTFKKNLRKNNTYEDMDKSLITKSIPMVQGTIGRVSLGAQGLSVLVLGNRFANFSAFINQGGDRYHGLGMIPRKSSIFTGLSGKFMNYGLSVSKDINGRSKGYIAKLDYSKMFFISENFMLRAGAGLEWHDDSYAEYYYGVRPHEVTASRREYHVNNYIQPGVGVFPIYKLSEKISVMAGVNLKYVPDEIRKSPTMNGDKTEVGALAGFNYSL
jgi:outer membrane scaffolding protein for murein synthesis (MipA/OmpV family)